MRNLVGNLKKGFCSGERVFIGLGLKAFKYKIDIF